MLDPRVGLRAAEVDGGDALVLDVLADTVKEPAADHAAAAVDYEDLGRALLGAELADILLLVLAEHELGGAIESKVVHMLTSIFNDLTYGFGLFHCYNNNTSARRETKTIFLLYP